MSSTGILEDNPEHGATEAAGLKHEHEGHEHEGHEHEGHEHEGHEHGPVLNPECTRELVIDVAANEVSAAFSKVAAKFRKFAKIPGFRAGKVPESVVRRRFAAEIRKEVIDTLLPERFNHGVRELGIHPVGQPRITELAIDDGAPFHVKAVFEFIPDFSIEGYREVKVDKPSTEVTEEEFEQEIEHQREQHAIMEPVEEDRPIQDGDWAEISYKGELETLPVNEAAAPAAEAAAPEGEAEAAAPEGEAAAAHDPIAAPDAVMGEDALQPAIPREPITGENVMVEIGGKDTLEAFNSALRGARPGQELKAEVVYPPDYNEPKLSGKSASFDIEVKGIKRRILPELNDEFAKEMAYQDLAEFKNYVRERMGLSKRRAVESETKDRLLAALAERFSFPVPESLVQEQIDTRLERGLRALAAQGMDPNQMRRLDFSRLRVAQRPPAVVDVKTQILLDRIANEENINVGDEEVDHELQLIARQTREPLDALKVRLTQDGGIARIREQLRRDKAASALYERLPAE